MCLGDLQDLDLSISKKDVEMTNSKVDDKSDETNAPVSLTDSEDDLTPESDNSMAGSEESSEESESENIF